MMYEVSKCATRDELKIFSLNNIPEAQKASTTAVLSVQDKERSLTMLQPTLFTNQEVKAIPMYRYVGGDKSLLYQHVLSPLAAFLTDLLPESVAPNLITFSGLLFPLTATLLVLLFNPTLGLDAPRGVRCVRRPVLPPACTSPYTTVHVM